MGLAFALGWTPCIGPILAAILAVAASEQTVAKGAGMLAVYSLGLGVPFLIAALAVEPFAAFLARFRAHLGLVEKAMGGLLVLTGIAFLTGTVSEASYWLLKPSRCSDRSVEQGGKDEGRAGAVECSDIRWIFRRVRAAAAAIRARRAGSRSRPARVRRRERGRKRLPRSLPAACRPMW